MMELSIVIPMFIAAASLLVIFVLGILGTFTDFDLKEKQKDAKSNVELSSLSIQRQEQRLNRAA